MSEFQIRMLERKGYFISAYRIKDIRKVKGKGYDIDIQAVYEEMKCRK